MGPGLGARESSSASEVGTGKHSKGQEAESLKVSASERDGVGSDV